MEDAPVRDALEDRARQRQGAQRVVVALAAPPQPLTRAPAAQKRRAYVDDVAAVLKKAESIEKAAKAGAIKA